MSYPRADAIPLRGTLASWALRQVKTGDSWRTRRAAVTSIKPGGTDVAALTNVAEVLIGYEAIVADADGRRWSAHVCGRRGDRKMWEGWIEFVPVHPKGRPVRSPRETTQPSRDDLLYWATGLTPVYLRGALDRALLSPLQRTYVRRGIPHFAGPAPSVVSASAQAPAPHPLLDPFDVYEQGEDILIRQLDALDTPHLRDIALAHELMRPREARNATRLDLAAAILEAARSRAARVRS